MIAFVLVIFRYQICITFILLCNKLPQTWRLTTTHIYYSTVSVGQISGYCMPGFPAQGLTRPKSRYSKVVFLYPFLEVLRNNESIPKSIQVASKIPLVCYSTESSSFCCQRIHSQLPQVILYSLLRDPLYLQGQQDNIYHPLNPPHTLKLLLERIQDLMKDCLIKSGLLISLC